MAFPRPQHCRTASQHLSELMKRDYQMRKRMYNGVALLSPEGIEMPGDVWKFFCHVTAHSRDTVFNMAWDPKTVNYRIRNLPEQTVEDVQEWMTYLVAQGHMTTYVVDGATYAYVTKWRQKDQQSLMFQKSDTKNPEGRLYVPTPDEENQDVPKPTVPAKPATKSVRLRRATKHDASKRNARERDLSTKGRSGDADAPDEQFHETPLRPSERPKKFRTILFHPESEEESQDHAELQSDGGDSDRGMLSRTGNRDGQGRAGQEKVARSESLPGARSGQRPIRKPQKAVERPKKSLPKRTTHKALKIAHRSNESRLRTSPKRVDPNVFDLQGKLTRLQNQIGFVPRASAPVARRGFAAKFDWQEFPFGADAIHKMRWLQSKGVAEDELSEAAAWVSKKKYGT